MHKITSLDTISNSLKGKVRISILLNTHTIEEHIIKVI